MFAGAARSHRTAAASNEAFVAIRRRLVDTGASDGTVNDFGGAQPLFP